MITMSYKNTLFGIGFGVAVGAFWCVGGASVMHSFMRCILDELDGEQIVLDLTMEEGLVNMAFGC